MFLLRSAGTLDFSQLEESYREEETPRKTLRDKLTPGKYLYQKFY